MKIIKYLLLIVGAGALVVTAVLAGEFALDAQLLMGAAQRYDQANNYLDPFQSMLVILGVGVAGAFVVGLGVGLPRRTAAAVREAALDGAAARREAEIRARATGDGQTKA